MKSGTMNGYRISRKKSGMKNENLFLF